MKIVLFVRILGSTRLCKISQKCGLLSNFGSLPKIRNARFGHCRPLGVKHDRKYSLEVITTDFPNIDKWLANEDLDNKLSNEYWTNKHILKKYAF